MFELQPTDDDGLHIAEVGDWSEDKHHFLRRYIDAFTTSMRLNRHGRAEFTTSGAFVFGDGRPPSDSGVQQSPDERADVVCDKK
jgi:hypothetical protein